MIAGDGPGTTMLKENDTQPVIVDLCQGLTLGLRIDAPVSPELARTGQRTPVVAPSGSPNGTRALRLLAGRPRSALVADSPAVSG
jgi:hypothetical protein